MVGVTFDFQSTARRFDAVCDALRRRRDRQAILGRFAFFHLSFLVHILQGCGALGNQRTELR